MSSETIDDRTDCLDGCMNKPERWVTRVGPDQTKHVYCELCGKHICQALDRPAKLFLDKRARHK